MLAHLRALFVAAKFLRGAALSALLIATLAACGGEEAAFHATFDGTTDVNGAAPVKTANLSFTAGISGTAVQIPTNGWLEYSFDPSYLKSEVGTVVFWAKTDWAYTGACMYRDHALTDDDIWGDLQSSRINRSYFMLGSWRGIRLSVNSSFSGWYVESWGSAGIRGRVRSGEWHQFATSYERESGRYRMYVDGNLLCDKTFTTPVDGIFPKTFTVGCGGTRGGGYGQRLGLEGAMDELRLYPRELSPDEIRADYVRYIPYRMELLDWTVREGETRAVRLRVRNLSTNAIARTFAFTTGDTVSLTLAPDELREFTVTVRGETPGLFLLEYNVGQADYRQFQMDCLAKPVDADVPSASAEESSQTLLGEYDCTKDYPTNVFNECGSRIVADSPCGAYREAVRFNPGTGFLYRFAILRKGRPHRLEIDYPDDAKREFSFGVWHENFGRLYTGSLDCGGILTGVDHPVTGTMQTKRLLFWPDSDTVSAGILAYKAIDGSRPPAVARVRLYELDGLPAAPNAGASAARRTVGVWDEDPTMDAQLAFTHVVNYRDADLEFWRVKWQRTIDYMRHQGLDTWVIKALSYAGDVTDMQATFGRTSTLQTADGRCPGWAEIGADMFDAAGMDFWIRYNHKYGEGDWIGPLGGGGPTTNYYFESSAGGAPESYGKGNFLRPEIRLAMKRILRAYRDKFRVYGHFRGITMNEAPGPYFDSIKIGYDDWTCALYTNETGLAGLPATATARYDFLVGDASRRADWIAWRCAKVTALARELTEALRDDGGDWELQFWIAPSAFTARDGDWFGWDPDESLKRCGVDLKALAQIPGLRVVPMVRPDYFRAHAQYDRNEPHFPYRASYQNLLRDAGVTGMNLIRHSNLEIYPSMTATSNMWLRAFWMTTGNNTGNVQNFYDYPTPHPNASQALFSTVQLIADYDLQDLLHGFWGLPESGEHERFRTLYSQLRTIPRGRFDLAPGANEPVAVRTGASGFYLVNREPYEVQVSWMRNGTRESATLSNCEIRYVPCAEAPSVTDVACTVPETERLALDARIATVEDYAAAHAADAALADVAERMRAAFSSNLFTTARGLLYSAPAREAILASQGLAVLRTGEPTLVWAHEWDVEDKVLPSHFLTSEWYQVGGTSAERAEKKARLGSSNTVSIVYSLSHDRIRGGLHLYARVAGGVPERLVLTFDPKNDDTYDDMGFSSDDVTYTFTEAGPVEGGYVGYEGFIPYDDLKGFEVKAGAEIGYTFVYTAVVTDDKGSFPVSIGPDSYGCKLRLSASRTGSTVSLSADSGKYLVKAEVTETPRELTLSFTPEESGRINFGASVSWSGTARVLDLTVSGATAPIFDLPRDLISDRQTLGGYLTVQAGVPVTVVATVAPRAEWKMFAEPDAFVDCVYSREGTQFVDTRIVPGSGTKVALDFAFLDQHPQTTSVIAGAKNADGFNVRAVGYTHGVRAYVGVDGYGRYSGMTNDLGALERYRTETVFKSRQNAYSQNGVRLDRSDDEKWHCYFDTSFAIPDFGETTLYLFANDNDGTAEQFARIALYGAKIWQEDGEEYVLVRDYRPCVLDGRAGLYDAVTKSIAFSGSGDDLLVSGQHDVFPETTDGVTPGRQLIAAVQDALPGDTIVFRKGTYRFADDEYMATYGSDKLRISVATKNLSFVGEAMTPRKTWTEGKEPVIIDVNGGRFALVKAKGVTFTGLTFTGARQVSSYRTEGGVIGHEDGGTSVSSNCVFRGNAAWWGGAVGCYGGTYRDCLFKDNVATQDLSQATGGAICRADAVTDCDFVGNRSGAAGAIENAPQIERCTFTGNVSLHGGYGCAAVRIADLKSVLRDCRFEANTNLNSKLGGVVRFEAADEATAVANDFSLLLTNCTFRGNYVQGRDGFPRGVALRSYARTGDFYPGTTDRYTDLQRASALRSRLVCEDCAFEGNCGTQGTFGGAASGITARRCTFRDNFTPDGYGYVWGDSVELSDLTDCDLSGGGEMSDCSLLRCTLHDIDGRSVFYRGTACHATNCLISNCRSSIAMIHNQKGGSEFVNCTFAGNSWGLYGYEYAYNATNAGCLYFANTNAAGKVCAIDVHDETDRATIVFRDCAFAPARPAGLTCVGDCRDLDLPAAASVAAGADATDRRVAEIMSCAADADLAGHVTNAAAYVEFLDWAGNLKLKGGGAANAPAALTALNAWLTYALGSETLLEALVTEDDLTVESFAPSAAAGRFDFTVSVKGVEVGPRASAENLKTVIGLSGGTSLDDLSPANVELTFSQPEGGKVKFSAGPTPAHAAAPAFFMKVTPPER